MSWAALVSRCAEAALTSLAESGELCEPEEKEDGACESLAADVTRKATGLSRCTAGAAAAAFDRALFIATATNEARAVNALALARESST